MLTTRAANVLGFLACGALLGFAYYAQFVLRLEPCPLCIFQRVGVFGIGISFLLAALLDPLGWPRRILAALIGSTALATAGIAIRHLYIQSLPPGTVAACGASLDFMLKVFSLSDVLVKVLSGSGECSKVDWRLLGLAMPAWVLIAAVGLGSFGIWNNLRRRPPILRF